MAGVMTGQSLPRISECPFRDARQGPLLWLLVAVLLTRTLPACAHTLPVSYLLLVADADYVHLELTFNPFELPEFVEADTNRNRRLDAAELQARAEALSRTILQHLSLRVGERDVPAESAGLSADPNSHHVTFRAHYRISTAGAVISIQSRLPEMFSSAHLTQVKCLREGRAAFAQLDTRSPAASFPAPQPVQERKRSRRSNVPTTSPP